MARLSLASGGSHHCLRNLFPKHGFTVPADAPFNLGLPEGTLEALEVELVPFTPRDP